jgi:TRAP transporter TAXI family solute receptor
MSAPALPLSRRIVLAGLASALWPAPAGAQSTRFLRIGTGGVTGTYLVIGGALAGALSSPEGLRSCPEAEGPCGVPGLIALAVTTAGSVANVAGLLNRDFESAFAQADIAFWAWRGVGPFEGKPPATSLRTLANLYPETFHLVAATESGIDGVAALRGKRVALDEPGSGTLVDARLLLEAFGLAETDLEPFYIKGGAALAGLREGKLDALIAVGGEPMPMVVEAINRSGAKLVPVTGPEVAELARAFPFITQRTVPAGTYGDLPAVPTLAVGAQWLTTDVLEDELAYDLVRVLFAPRTLERLKEAHPRGAEIQLGTATKALAVPLHPGAERFYRERSVLSDH